ncbi:histidine phosphatase family protein [Chroococcidiopsis sp. FACHB-1243]|uniref:histidine phosphatase family protein n=1 Tax=Chroococcidiopsis sp. [FACHB-1243] TaxID=2692781 RepID=UPI001786A8AE|nr:histidine phosphatase family protein [Chroococcidiopsis sp. [FACHB-1243]]MBD2304281.1 histidine phosphatase family protein [Chroococcidiopsis sp. [FACHB-1243]]
MTTRVVIVRHGQSSYNAERRIQGRSDVSVLTEQGREDALKVGAALSNLNFAAIYSSPLQRARQTAEIVRNCFATTTPLTVTEQLLEIDLPLWEKLTVHEVKEKFPADYRLWHEFPHEFKMELQTPQGTKEHFPVLALYQQARQFWQDILSRHAGETILIVGHNGINRALLSTAIGISPSRYHSIQQSNCGISVLNFKPPFPPAESGSQGGSVQLESMNQLAHLGRDVLPSFRPNHQGQRILLIRHGETEWNRQTKFQGQIDVPLNDNGREQARKAAEFLKTVKLDFAFSSPMLRPKETAEIILQHHPETQLKLYDGLREIGHGLWEGKLEAEIEQTFPGELERWRTVPGEVQMPEGENLQQVWERSVVDWQTMLASVTDRPQTGIVVAHDATNKVLLCHVLGLSTAQFWNFRQGNGAVTVIDYPQGLNGLPVLQAMNITTHLGGGVLDKTAAGAL